MFLRKQYRKEFYLCKLIILNLGTNPVIENKQLLTNEQVKAVSNDLKNNLNNGLYIKDSNLLNNESERKNLEQVLGASVVADIQNYINQASEGYEVKLEPIYGNNGKLIEVNVIKLIGQDKEELNAMFNENKLRKEQGLKERASYGKYGR